MTDNLGKMAVEVVSKACRLLVLGVALPALAHAGCVGGGPVIQQICFADVQPPLSPSQWYFTGTDAFTGAQTLDQLTSLVQQEYFGLVNNTSLSFVDGEAGFTAAALGKLTNLQAYAYISQLCFLTGAFDSGVEPSLGNGFGPFTLTPQGQRVLCQACQSTFATGIGKPYYSKFCVTGNGNIIQFEAPLGIEHLQSGIGEGYAVCDMTSGTNYFDYAGGGSSGWNSPMITQPHGPNTFPLTIARTTLDGLWTLTQKFAATALERSATITMSLKNNAAAAKSALLLRYADVNAHSSSNNRFDYTQDSAWGYVPPSCASGPCVSDFGFMVQAVPSTMTAHGAFIQNSSSAPNACSTGALVPAQTPFDGDGSLFLQFSLSTIKQKATQTVVLKYRPL